MENANSQSSSPIPIEEYHSLKETYTFLCHLIDPQKYPRLPKYLRDRAKLCLKNYPVRRKIQELDNGICFFNPEP